MNSAVQDRIEPEVFPSYHVGPGSIEVYPLTATIGAELRNVSLAQASRDAGLFTEIRALLLQHKVLFFRDQDITRGEHVALAERFGPLEDHPSLTSDPTHPARAPT